MRTKNIMAFSIVMLLAFSTFIMGAGAVSSISHTDPAGDADFYGSAASLADNADITLLEVDDSSDPVVFTLTVSGKIILSSEINSYFYFFYINQNGDSDYESAVSFSIIPGIIMATGSSEIGSPYFMVTGSGNDTNTLTFEVSAADMGADSSPIVDVYAEVLITDAQYNSASDVVNEDFGGVVSDDDDDDTPTDDDDDTPTDDDDDTPTDDDDDDDDWDDWDDWDDEMIPDPLKETPTDTSIGVSIDDVEMSLDKSDGSFEIEQEGSGTTEGDVVHCSMTIVTYYDDGTYEAEDWTVGPEVEDRASFMGMTFEMYFKGTGPDGDDDWSKWEMYTYVKAPESMLEELTDSASGDDDDDNETEPEVTGTHFVIRAYSDESEENWNQDSADIMEMYEKFLGGEEFSGSLSGLDGKKDSPAPGVVIILGMLAAVALIGVVAGFRKRE